MVSLRFLTNRHFHLDSILCHIRAHALPYLEPAQIQYEKWHPTEAFLENLAKQIDISTTLADIIQEVRATVSYRQVLDYHDTNVTSLEQCITNCTLVTDSKATRLKLLQDLCAKSSHVPLAYRITNVKEGKCIGVGGEATVYDGIYQGHNVAIRRFHPPKGGNWESNAGQLIHKVSFLFFNAFIHSAHHGDTSKLIIRESIMHWQLRHKNIVEFLGLQQSLEAAAPPAMVLLRAKHSSATEYLLENSNPEVFLSTVWLRGYCIMKVYSNFL